jgi:hypothetical protein
MSSIDKKEVLKIYEIFPDRLDFIYAYINRGGLITQIKDTYSSETEWIIWGSLSQFPTTVGNTINDPTQGPTGENIISLQEKERNGQLFIVERDTAGPYIVKNDLIYYIHDIDSSGENRAIFTFKVNPTHITLQKRKLQTKIRTKGGFVFQQWGPDISEIALEGTTGNITPSGISFRQTNIPGIGEIPLPHDLSSDIPTEDNSPMLKAFRQLETLYDDDQNEEANQRGRRIALEYRGRIYVGHLSDFFYEERGERPFQLYYRLTFLVHFEATSTSSAETTATTNLQRNESTVQILNEIRKASNNPSNSSA